MGFPLYPPQPFFDIYILWAPSGVPPRIARLPLFIWSKPAESPSANMVVIVVIVIVVIVVVVIVDVDVKVYVVYVINSRPSRSIYTMSKIPSA